MENMMRQDGCPLQAAEIFPVIKARVEKAEYAAAHVDDSAAVWGKYYNDLASNNFLISDFKFLMELCEAQNREILSLRAQVADKDNALEAAGVEVEA